MTKDTTYFVKYWYWQLGYDPCGRNDYEQGMQTFKDKDAAYVFFNQLKETRHVEVHGSKEYVHRVVIGYTTTEVWEEFR
jgi:hypothetical protein